MSATWLYLLIAGGIAIALAAWAFYRMGREVQVERARESFRLQSDLLSDAYLKAAAATGKPRGMRWVSCHFTAEFTLARDHVTRKLAALVPVTIQFDPDPESDMALLPAAKEPRHGTAVFHFRKGRWVSDGQTLFNVSPEQALRIYAKDFDQMSAAESH